ncbi:EF-hand domain-containing protein [Amorphus sp. 3PC139-8]|uniref:EF-hand domain-containing protein n=1 Tax=Amorphus sp. 3PC139-8 TaxID=2735676 RepID=UPI00345CA0D3
MTFRGVSKVALAAALAFTAVPATVAFAQDQETPTAEAPAGPPSTGRPGPGFRSGRGPMGGMMMKRFDSDGDGNLTIEEFSVIGEGPIARFDTDGDGSITSEEIDAVILERMVERRRQRVLDRFDLNGDGTISAEELTRQREKMFALMDRNDDGVVDAKERRMFRKAMREMGMMGGHGPRGMGPQGKHAGPGPRGKDDCGPRGGYHHGWRHHDGQSPRWSGHGPGWGGHHRGWSGDGPRGPAWWQDNTDSGDQSDDASE